MFNKRDSSSSENQPAPRTPPRNESSATEHRTETPRPVTPPGAKDIAIIGSSISINGELKGAEDLIVQGRITGTIELKSNTLTVGPEGRIDAEVFAHTILVEGTVNGDLYASERISIQKSARISGNILAPRISLEDGARFKGSIDMDSESEKFRKAFEAKPSKPGASTNGKADESTSDKAASSQQPHAGPGQKNGKISGSAA
ncbi:MAG: polymer-forming cytoskeletal protein [Xanthomonadaceae bacterium]|nr:polymer-forming cytoskeletal protein [Xanthomonadaceae bacterium]